jgi:uncharacterized membrane protein
MADSKIIIHYIRNILTDEALFDKRIMETFLDNLTSMTVLLSCSVNTLQSHVLLPLFLLLNLLFLLFSSLLS